jgi:hypothetical protein
VLIRTSSDRDGVTPGSYRKAREEDRRDCKVMESGELKLLRCLHRALLAAVISI